VNLSPFSSCDFGESEISSATISSGHWAQESMQVQEKSLDTSLGTPLFVKSKNVSRLASFNDFSTPSLADLQSDVETSDSLPLRS